MPLRYETYLRHTFTHNPSHFCDAQQATHALLENLFFVALQNYNFAALMSEQYLTLTVNI